MNEFFISSVSNQFIQNVTHTMEQNSITWATEIIVDANVKED
jgi:hypothetical protein